MAQTTDKTTQLAVDIFQKGEGSIEEAMEKADKIMDSIVDDSSPEAELKTILVYGYVDELLSHMTYNLGNSVALLVASNEEDDVEEAIDLILMAMDFLDREVSFLRRSLWKGTHHD